MKTTDLPQLLADSPAEADLLGAHSRIAEGLHALIRSNPGGKTIALEGPWGSGKSTVIELLKSKCLNSDIYVHTHDAWAHEGDPLRRAFLESLMSAMIDRKWLEPGDYWRKQLQKLALRIKDITRKTEPSLTGFGKALSVSLLVVPFGIALFGQGVRTPSSGWQILLGVALGCLPLFLIGGFLLKRWVCDETTADILAVVLNRTTTEETSSITESVDPTSIEFQAIFSSMLASAVSDARVPVGRKLVIVVDNLDRISTEEAAEVWALLRSFLDMPQHKGREWIESLWVIVPLVNVNRSGEAMEAVRLVRGDSSSESSSVGQSEGFLDKVFQASFSLPPATLQNWRACMAKMLVNAKLANEAQDLERVVDLYSAHRSKGSAPTPRELISFINQMVVLSVQWGNQFSPLSLAAYVLDSAEGDFAENLQKRFLPSKTALNFGGRELTSEYACLYFNTGDVAEALDLLQQPIAEKILSERDSSGLANEILKAASFSLVFSRIVDRDLPGLLQRDIEAAFAVSATILSARFVESADAAGAWTRLDELQAKVCDMISRFAWSGDKSPVDLSDSPVVLREYMSRLDGDMIERVILPALTSEVTTYVATDSVEDSTKTEARATRWIDGFLAMMEDARLRQLIETLAAPTLAKIPSTSFATLVRRCHDQGIEAVAIKMLPFGGVDAIVSALEVALRTGSLADDDVFLYGWLRRNYPDKSDEDLRVAAEARLEDPDPLHPWSLVAHIAFLFSLVENDRSPILERLAVGGAFANQYAQAREVEELQAVCLLAHILGAGSSSPQSRFGQSPAGWAGISTVIADPAGHMSMLPAIRLALNAHGLWANWIDRAASEPVLRSLTSSLTEDKESLKFYILSLPISSFRERVDQVGELLNDPNMVRYFAVDARITGAGFAVEVSGLPLTVEDAWLLLICMETLEHCPKSLIEAAETLILSLTAQQWKDALLEGETWELALAEALVERREGIGLVGYDLKSPLLDAIRHLSEDSSVEEKGDIVRARALLVSDLQAALDDDVFEYVAGAQQPLNVAFWGVGGKMLSSSIERATDGGKVGRRIFIPLVHQRDVAGLAWLADFLRECGPLKSVFGDQASFREFPSALQASVEASRSDAERIALERVKLEFEGAKRRKRPKVNVLLPLSEGAIGEDSETS